MHDRQVMTESAEAAKYFRKRHGANRCGN